LAFVANPHTHEEHRAHQWLVAGPLKAA
jgi:hypothetical protein